MSFSTTFFEVDGIKAVLTDERLYSIIKEEDDFTEDDRVTLSAVNSKVSKDVLGTFESFLLSYNEAVS